MLTKKEIEQLIDQQNSCLKIVKPIVTPKSLPVWKSFSCIYAKSFTIIMIVSTKIMNKNKDKKLMPGEFNKSCGCT